MSGDPETTRIVRSWLDDGVTQLPDRVLDRVLDQVPATPQRRATWWPARRTEPMNAMLKFGLAAAVVAVIILIGVTSLGGSSNVGGPAVEPTPSPEASAAEPTPEPSPTAEDTFNLSLPQYPIAIDVTIPSAFWSRDQGGGVITSEGADPPSGAGIITFVDPGYYVYDDPCQWSTTRPDTPSTTVDELVAALSAQALRDASAPVDISLGGYVGKSMTLHVPEDADFAECDEDAFASWGVDGEDPARYHQGPGQIDKLWILDVDDHLVIIDTAYYAGTPQDVVDELDAIVESAVFSEQP